MCGLQDKHKSKFSVSRVLQLPEKSCRPQLCFQGFIFQTCMVGTINHSVQVFFCLYCGNQTKRQRGQRPRACLECSKLTTDSLGLTWFNFVVTKTSRSDGDGMLQGNLLKPSFLGIRLITSKAQVQG